MLNSNTIISQANSQLSADVDVWIDKELYDIDKCPKSFSKIFAEFVLLSALGNPKTSVSQQQCFLSKLLTLK